MGQIDFSNSAEKILAYAGLGESDRTKVITAVKSYAALNDQFSSDDAVRKLRKELNSYFYEIYKLVFFKTMEGDQIPDEVLMFLFFGYIDEKLAGTENTMKLYEAARSIGLDEEMRIFTFYQWLRLIYNGKKDPSVNEFSEDYVTKLRKMKREGSITESEERELLHDGRKRVIFEIDSMFKNGNRMMSDRITTFVPFFSQQAVTKPIENTLLGFEIIHKTLNIIRAVDFSLFYRQTVFAAPELGLDRAFIQVEVLPDIILMPCVGARGAMWQEITGAKRTTPGRFLLPIALEDELSKVLLGLCGEFRWELCKRVQGARWNDLTERSLTSDYVDYIDTYKKNHDLSAEAKERITAAMAKHRKSYKEMFVADYVTYIQYESSGAIRHNKVVRLILFNYCPFSKAVREGAIATNPQYVQLIERYKNKNAHDVHLFDIATSRIEKGGHQIPEELRGHSIFLRL